MITRETDYAIRALLFLALQGDKQIVSTTVLAEEMDIPYRFLRRIVLRLVAQGLINSVRGKAGGLRLAKSPAAVSLLDVVGAVDPDAITMNICLTGEHGCSRAPHCAVHEELAAIQQQLHRSLADISLATLAERERHNKGI